METTEKQNELALLVDGNQLESETAIMLKEKFMPFFEKAIEWKEKALALVVTDINQTEEMKRAREARLLLKDIRVGADKIRKELKEDSLRYGKAVQSVYNMIENVIVPIEDHLLLQEKFVEIEEERIKKELYEQRIAELKPYEEFVPLGIDFGNMVEEDYLKFLKGVKLQLADKIKREEEDKAAFERQKQIEAEQREAQRIENEKLKAEKKEREAEEKKQQEIREKRAAELKPYMQFVRDYESVMSMSDNNFQGVLSDLKVLKEEFDKAEDERKKKEKELADKLAAEKAQKEKAEKELADKKAKEEKELADRLAKEEEELSKGDTAKMADVVVALNSLKTKYEFKSKKFQKKYKDVGILIDKIIEHIHN